jgi:hypothetical protein
MGAAGALVQETAIGVEMGTIFGDEKPGLDFVWLGG